VAGAILARMLRGGQAGAILARDESSMGDAA